MSHESDKPDWLRANEELDARLVDAMCSKNLEGVVSCFADTSDLIVVIWGTEMHGPSEFRQAVESIFSQCEFLKFAIERIHRVQCGDVVMAVGHATYTMHANGHVSSVREVWTDVRCQLRGRWVYVLDHAEMLPGS